MRVSLSVRLRPGGVPSPCATQTRVCSVAGSPSSGSAWMKPVAGSACHAGSSRIPSTRMGAVSARATSVGRGSDATPASASPGLAAPAP